MTQPQKRLGHYGALSLASLVALVIVGACETPVPSFQPEEATEPELQAVETEQATAAYAVPYTVAPAIQNREQIVAALEAEYPPVLRDAGIGGTVRIMVFIDERGVLTDLRIDESSGHQALDDAALRVGRVFDFSAALNDDKPVGAWIALPITFEVR